MCVSHVAVTIVDAEFSDIARELCNWISERPFFYGATNLNGSNISTGDEQDVHEMQFMCTSVPKICPNGRCVSHWGTRHQILTVWLLAKISYVILYIVLNISAKQIFPAVSSLVSMDAKRTYQLPEFSFKNSPDARDKCSFIHWWTIGSTSVLEMPLNYLLVILSHWNHYIIHTIQENWTRCSYFALIEINRRLS